MGHDLRQQRALALAAGKRAAAADREIGDAELRHRRATRRRSSRSRRRSQRPRPQRPIRTTSSTVSGKGRTRRSAAAVARRHRDPRRRPSRRWAAGGPPRPANRELLPEPFGPSTATETPYGTSRSISSRRRIPTVARGQAVGAERLPACAAAGSSSDVLDGSSIAQAPRAVTIFAVEVSHHLPVAVTTPPSDSSADRRPRPPRPPRPPVASTSGSSPCWAKTAGTASTSIRSIRSASSPALASASGDSRTAPRAPRSRSGPRSSRSARAT